MIATLNGQTGRLLLTPAVRTTAAFLSVDRWIGGRLHTVRGQRMPALCVLSVDAQGAPAPAVAVFSLS